MTRPPWLRAAAIATFLMPAADAHAQTVNYAIPESPAFTFLGVNPSKVARPGTTRDLGVSILSGIDSTGRVTQGFALDFTLWTVIPGFDVPLAKVQTSWPHRVLSNLQVSLATARATDDTASTDIALGVRATLVDNGDPMFDQGFTGALGTALLACAPAAPGRGRAARAEREGCLANARKGLADTWLEDHWNELRVSVGFGTGIRAIESRFGQREWLGWSAWGAGSLPLGRVQGLAFAQYDQRQAIDTVPGFKTLMYGARLNLGSSSVNGYVEVVGKRLFDVPAGTDRGSGSWSGGVEFRAGDTLWLSTGFGSQFATETPDDKIVIIAGIRWAISDGARYR